MASSPRKIEPNHTPPSVRADELLTVAELARRLRWQKHSLRQAKRLGLPTVRFGSRDYCVGRRVLAWFERLGEQQQTDEQDSGEGEQ